MSVACRAPSLSPILLVAVLIHPCFAQEPSSLLQLDTTWGEFGNAAGTFHQPKGIDVMDNGQVVVMDTWNNRVQIFSAEGAFVDSWGMFPAGDAGLYGPSDVIIDAQGNVVVSNDLRWSLNVYTVSGGFRRQIRTAGVSPTVAVDGDGNYYVSELDYSPTTYQIEKFDPAGRSLFVFGRGHLLYPPNGIVITSADEVLVSDTGHNRILVFDTEGNYLRQFAGSGASNGMVASPHGLAVDSSGHVYVADTGNHRIQVFSAEGAYLTQLGSFGVEPGQFRYPWDIAVSSSGLIYVTDTFNHRIQRFRFVPSLITSVRRASWGKIKSRYLDSAGASPYSTRTSLAVEAPSRVPSRTK